MKLSSKLPIIFIAILVLGIGFIQYRIINVDLKKQKEIGSVKSASTQKIADVPKLDLSIINPLPQKVKNYKEPNNIWAKNYVLIYSNSYYPLAQKNAHQQVSIASTTKIMTAVIALENYNPNDIVTISQNAATQIGSEVMLKIGEKITVESLLYALLVQSGNDAAMALAEHYQGGLNSFVEAMNSKAIYLGLHDTNYKDPAGLDDTGKSTPYDLAIVTSYALTNPLFEKIVKTNEININSIDGKFSHKLTSSNRLIKPDELLYYPQAQGVKTGYTPTAGHCLVSSAQINGKRLVGVILNTNESSNDASAKESKKLLDWGFSNYEL